MPPRPYNNESRLRQQAEMKTRIAAAAARLHAEKGPLETSWADIAQAAGVSLPTVYKHFPDFDTLIPACIGHTVQFAPPMPVERILASASLEEAAQQLADACDPMNAYLEPWLVWGAERQLPPVAHFLEEQRGQLTRLCRGVLQRHRPDAPSLDEMAAQWQSLLDFKFWHALVRQHQLTRAAVRRHTAHLLLAVSGPRPAETSPRPNRKK